MYAYSKQFVDRLRPETGAFRLCPRFGSGEIAYGVLPAEQSYVHVYLVHTRYKNGRLTRTLNPLGPPRALLWGPEKRATQVSGAPRAPSETTRGEVLANFPEKPEKCLTCWIHILRSGPISGEVSIAICCRLTRNFCLVKFTVLVRHMPMAVDLWFSQPRRIEKTWTVRNVVNPQL